MFHNLFGRFPDLRVVSIENGAGWVGPLMREMDHVARLAGPRDWTYGHCPGRPSEIFKQHVKISPFNPKKIFPPWSNAVGNPLESDNVLAGSDWPHPEGCAWTSRLITWTA